MGENLAFGLFAGLFCASVALVLVFGRCIRRRKPPVRWPQLVVGNVLVLLSLAALFLLAGESYYRFLADSTDSLLFTKVSQRWMQRHWHQNQNGVRDNVEYSLTREKGRRRVSFVGDSFTAAEGVKDVEDRFVNRVRKAHPEWEVHMLAEPGFDTGEELFYLRAALQKGYQVDEVVLVYCLNDVSDMLQEHFESVRRIKRYVVQSGWLSRNSYFVNTLDQRIKASRDPFMKDYFGFVREAYRGPVWDRQKERLMAFREMVQTNGGRLSVVIFPFLNALGPHYDYGFVHDELNQFCRDCQIPCLDLLTIYKDLPSKRLMVNRHDAHPNEFANLLAADAIDRFLNEKLSHDPEPAPTGH